MKKKIYTAPSIEIVDVEIEKGFAGSGMNTYANEGEAGQLTEGETYEW